MVQGTVRMLRKAEENMEIVVSSKDDIAGDTLHIEGVDRFLKRYTYNRNNKPVRYFIGVLRYILKLKTMTNWMNHYTLLHECKSADLVIVVGGDNYDYTYGAFDDMHSLNRTMRKIVNGNMMLLNCSFGPKDITEKVLKDLALFDKVTVRDSLSYQTLMDNIDEGDKYAIKGKTELLPDIAFAMLPKKIDISIFENTRKTAGINLSTLILREKYTKNKNLIISEYKKIVQYLLKKNYTVLLIPHVMQGADLDALKMVASDMNDENLILLENEKLSSPELKYIISQCDLYMGARTHSTIAAYGSRIPTYVLGYSIKSLGIAKDIYGDYNKHVLPVQSVNQEDMLYSGFVHFFQQVEEEKQYLQTRIPEYIDDVMKYEKVFKGMLEKNGKQ